MTRILFLLFLVVVVLTGIIIVRGAKESYKILPADLEKPMTVTAFEEWREFTSDQGNFKVFLPAVPQHAAETLPEPKSQEVRTYNMYVAEKDNGTIFMVSLITYPAEANLSDPEQLLDNVMKEMMGSSPENKLLAMNQDSFLGYRAIDFSIENKEVHINSKAFLVDNTLYLLTYVANNENYNEEEYQHFVNTFQLLP